MNEMWVFVGTLMTCSIVLSDESRYLSTSARSMASPPA